MNYNHLNKVFSYWRKKILPHLTHNFTVLSFDDYIKKFSFLPSGKWIHDMEKFKLSRIGFAIDPEKFIKKYENCCVTYNAPARLEDGLQRIIYQIFPTLHVELGLWVWIEHDNIQSYGSLLTCYHNEEEYAKFVDEIYNKMKREGDTEEKPVPLGFFANNTFNGNESK